MKQVKKCSNLFIIVYLRWLIWQCVIGLQNLDFFKSVKNPSQKWDQSLPGSGIDPGRKWTTPFSFWSVTSPFLFRFCCFLEWRVVFERLTFLPSTMRRLSRCGTLPRVPFWCIPCSSRILKYQKIKLRSKLTQFSCHFYRLDANKFLTGVNMCESWKNWYLC